MSNLDYRGFRSTRLVTCIVASLVATLSLFAGMATFAEWSGFIQWVIGIYAGSEVITKGTEAWRDRGAAEGG